MLTLWKEVCRTKKERIPDDVYKRNTNLACSYYALLKRRREIEHDILMKSGMSMDGMPHGTDTGDPTAGKAEQLIRRKATLDKQIGAIQSALGTLPDNFALNFITRNLFCGIPMKSIDAPYSERTMKRIRSDFIRTVAEYMGEA